MPRMDGTGPFGTGPVGGICYRRTNNAGYGCGRGLGRGYGFRQTMGANQTSNKDLLKAEKERLVQRIEEIDKQL